MEKNLLLAAVLTLFAADLFGQYINSQATIATRSLSEIESVAPDKLNFGSAPNPFTQQTFISIQLPQSGKVSLAIFDILGQKVATVINGFIKKGNHRIKYYGSKLPAGGYYFHLNAGGKVLVRTVLKRD